MSQSDADDVVRKIYQTDAKLSAQERDAARHTHASPSCNLNAAKGVPNDAKQRKNGQKMAQASGLQDAFRHLHPQAREFTHKAASGSSSARVDRWLVTDSLLPDIDAAKVSDLRPSDHYGVSLSISQLLHPHVARAYGQCHPASSHTLPSRPS